MKPSLRAVLAVAVVAIGATAAAEGSEETIVLADGPGSSLTAGRCVTCHSLDYIEMNGPVLDRAGWEKTVRKMIDRFGAPVSDGEAAEIVSYLAAKY